MLLQDREKLASFLSSARTVDALCAKVEDVLASILGVRADFAHVTLFHISSTLDPFGTYDDRLTDHYQREGFHLADLATRYLIKEKKPIFRSRMCEWADSSPFENEDFIRLHREASRFLASVGMHDVYNYVISDLDSNYLASFSISIPNCDSIRFKQLVEANIPIIHALADLTDHVGRSKFKRNFHDLNKNPRVPMTLKAIQIIQTLANKRCLVEEAFAVHGVSTGYGNRLLAQARKVMGSNSTTALILDAAEARYIDLGTAKK